MFSALGFCFRVVTFLNLLKKLHNKVLGIFSGIDGKLYGPNKFHKSFTVLQSEREGEKESNRSRKT